MKRLLLTGALLLAVAASSRSLAADLPLKAPPAPVPIWGWTEFYFGLNIGEAYGHTSWCTDASTANCAVAGVTPTDVTAASASGAVVGGQFGYRWQAFDYLVLGFEGMLDGLAINKSAPSSVVAGETLSTSFNSLESVTGQLGIAFTNRFLVYGKGGWAATDLHFDANNAIAGSDLSTFKWVGGWTVGAGVEYLLWTHLSIGVEYDYYQFNVGNITGLADTTGVMRACSFCDFGRTNVQTILGRVNIKLWPWGS
jgi:outer membrane immunogenic protein